MLGDGLDRQGIARADHVDLQVVWPGVVARADPRAHEGEGRRVGFRGQRPVAADAVDEMAGFVQEIGIPRGCRTTLRWTRVGLRMVRECNNLWYSHVMTAQLPCG